MTEEERINTLRNFPKSKRTKRYNKEKLDKRLKSSLFNISKLMKMNYKKIAII